MGSEAGDVGCRIAYNPARRHDCGQATLSSYAKILWWNELVERCVCPGPAGPSASIIRICYLALVPAESPSRTGLTVSSSSVVAPKSLASNFRYAQTATDFPRQHVGHFGVAWHGFHLAGVWIRPERMGGTFALQLTPHAFAGGVTALRASLNNDNVSNGVLGRAAQSVLAAIL